MKTGLILGFFDGVHLGHQAVIKTANGYADETILITLNPSPAMYFNKPCRYILSRKESLSKICSLGVDKVVELDFGQVVNMSAEEYLQFLINKFSPSCISIGFNHTFGKNKQGTPEFLEKNQEKYNYKYFCTQPQIFEEEVISSTLIKNLLSNGKIEKANYLLGSNFCIEGTVIKGAQLGRTIGFPTANILYPQEIIEIPYGVYCARIGEQKCILNWGIKPTVNNTKEPIAEAHIIDFNEDIYGQKIKIEILKKLRDEKKFNNLEELKQQIKKDLEECLKL